MKTLLFISPAAYPLGGVATWLDYLIPGLERKGWRIVLGLVSGRFHNVESYLATHPLKQIVTIENRTGSREGRVRSIMRLLCELNPDIVVGVNIPDSYAAVERLREKNLNAPRAVMTIHAIQPDFYEDARGFDHVLDAVVCTNKLACKLVEKEAGIGPKRIFYAPYGVELPEAAQQWRSDANKLRIAYSGRIDHFQKRINDIPKILNRLEENGMSFEFIIAGGGPAERDLLEEIHRVGLSRKVNFLGPLSYDDLVQKVYQSCDILLITSFWETGPIVAWEAMSYGMAVVTSNYVGSGLEGSLKDNVNCLIFPVGDADKAASCIGMLAEAGVRERLIRRGYELVRERYTYDQSVNLWAEAFRKIDALPPMNRDVKVERPPTTGRLDTLLGVRKAESIRRLVGKRFIHNGPGGEWPHSYGKRRENDKDFWEFAQGLDKA